MSDLLQTSLDRLRQEQDEARRKIAVEEAAFNANLDRCLTEAEEAVGEFLRLMAAHGNPGLRRWERRQVKSKSGGRRHNHYQVLEVSRGGWQAWSEAGYLLPSGEFFAGGQTLSANVYLRSLLTRPVKSGYFEYAPTVESVRERCQYFGQTLARLLISHGVAI